MKNLERLKNGENLKKFNINELCELASEIREFLVENVSKSGGHLASNHGVVELTIALHYVFDFPTDKVIFDVGHQAYIHKILSGRTEDFKNLRKLGGMSGFPKTSESPYDCFNTGHASTSISAALGMAKARDLKGEKNEIIAVIGDGSLGGGLAFEAINDLGNSNTKMLIILNDNEMSISKNVGGISVHLSSIRTSGRYFKLKQKVLTFLEKNEHTKLIALIRSAKNAVKGLLMSNTVFEGLGLTYFGPFEGHDIKQLITVLERVKKLKEPVIMHVRTVKGKGYSPAELEPSCYHGVSGFDCESGAIKTASRDYSAVFGETLINIAQQNEKVVAITAAMPDGTGLKNFSEKFPKRFFDVGIAEQHAVTTAAGMTANGLIPVVAIYSTFMQRAFDSILHDVCMQNLHVVFCADRAGIVGADGETHQGIFDISFMRPMPGVEILAPADYISFKNMLYYAVNIAKGPVFLRYPRGSEKRRIYNTFEYTPGKAVVLKEGDDVCITACGNMVAKALEVAEILENEGIKASVIDLCCLSCIDFAKIAEQAKSAKLLVTIEDNVLKGGMGEEVARLLVENCFNLPVINKAYLNGIIEHGKPEAYEAAWSG